MKPALDRILKGKTIINSFSSKKHFTWEFTLDGKTHKIELYDSRISGKKKLIKDGGVITDVEEDFAFSKTFEVGTHSCTIIQHGDKFELRIDNQVFTHMMDLEKNKIHFGKNSAPTSIQITSNVPGQGSNKIGFGIASSDQQFKQSKVQPNAPLFNFSIKPMDSSQNQRKFSEINPVVDLNRQKFEKIGNNENQQSVTSNNSNLLDFGNDLMPTNNQQNHHEFTMKLNHNNNIDLLGGATFGNNDNNNHQKIQSNNQQMLSFDLISPSNAPKQDPYQSGNK